RVFVDRWDPHRSDRSDTEDRNRHRGFLAADSRLGPAPDKSFLPEKEDSLLERAGSQDASPFPEPERDRAKRDFPSTALLAFCRPPQVPARAWDRRRPSWRAFY